MGLSFEQVAEGTGLSLETVEQLDKEILSLVLSGVHARRWKC